MKKIFYIEVVGGNSQLLAELGAYVRQGRATECPDKKCKDRAGTTHTKDLFRVDADVKDLVYSARASSGHRFTIYMQEGEDELPVDIYSNAIGGPSKAPDTVKWSRPGRPRQTTVRGSSLRRRTLRALAGAANAAVKQA